jgi:hypothetical protein
MLNIKTMTELAKFPQLYEAVKKSVDSYRLKMADLSIADVDIDNRGAELYLKVSGKYHLDISIDPFGAVTNVYYDGEDEEEYEGYILGLR